MERREVLNFFGSGILSTNPRGPGPCVESARPDAQQPSSRVVALAAPRPRLRPSPTWKLLATDLGGRGTAAAAAGARASGGGGAGVE